MPLFRARRTDATSPGDPDRLGPDFVRLWWSSAATNLGDGALLAAGPLLVASLTDSATVVAGASAAQLLPTLLFSLTSGALVDRLPRRTVLLAANLVRASVLALFAVALVFGAPPLWSLFIVLFAVGTSETLADGAYGALLVSLVPRPLLGRANARLALTFSVNNQLVGPPLGALLFGLGWALPYGLKASCAWRPWCWSRGSPQSRRAQVAGTEHSGAPCGPRSGKVSTTCGATAFCARCAPASW